nr:carboxypeptidase regulatory-like domain-containing protein [Blastocatellia bacterium]
MMSKKTLSSILLALAVSICLSSLAIGQEISGSVVGTVKDSAGAVVPGATVTLTDPAKDNQVIRTVSTNEGGEFTAANVPISTYDITVEAPNFKKAVSTGVKVDVGQRRNVEIALTAGDVSETVTIEADRVSVELNTPTVATTISGDQVRELPINNRNFVQLLTLAPGVSSNLADQVYVGTTNPDGQANTIQISVNGARSSQNTFTVDGADITDRGSNLTIQAYPSVDSIGEFKVLRSLYPAESGRSGGGQVNIVTRSGGDEFHGSFFEFVRNERFNAGTYFNNQTQPRDANGKATRPPFRYNNFGLTVGGPIYFLKFGEKEPGDPYFGKIEKTYFFFSQEFRHDIRFPTLNSNVPSAGLRQGVFTVPICLQATGTTCNSVLNAGTPLSSVATINPISQQYLTNIYNKLPLPNVSQFGLSFPTRGVSKFHQEIVKVDTSFSEDWTAYYRYQNDTIPTVDANALFSQGSSLPGVSTTETNSPGRTHTFNTNYVITPNLLVDAGYTYGYGAILSSTVGTLALSNSPITPPLPFPVQRDRVPTVTGNGFSNRQGFGPYDNFSWKQNVNGAVTWIKGNHTMKFGTVYSMYRKNEN